MSDIRMGWSRGPIGYREARLEASDFTAAMTLFVAGIPSLLVGMELAGMGVGIGQLILSAPLGAVGGALVMGMLGKQAAGSGAPGAYLGRAAFGSIGNLPFSIARIALTVSWAALILRIAGSWVIEALSTWNRSVMPTVPWGVLAVLAIAAFFPGPSWAARILFRKWMFPIAVIILLVAAWRILSNPGEAASEARNGGFFIAIDAVFGLAILWSTIGTDLSGYSHRDEEAATGLAYGYAIGTLLFVVAGAAIASRLDGVESVLTLLGTGTLGAILGLLWVPLMEVDGLAGLTAATSWSTETVLPWIPPRALSILAGGGAFAAAYFLEYEMLRSIADLSLSLVAAGLAVILTDSYLVRGGAYSADELFHWHGDYGFLNLIGIGSWATGAVVTVWLRPKSDVIREWLPTWPGDGPGGLPGLLIGFVVAGLLYAVIGRLIYAGGARTYRMRGV
jgi:purine-cytosine permease-like protein